jgi:carbon storage regulator
MLVLTRKEGQLILIDGVTVEVVAINGKKVRIGIHAPEDVSILRGEIADSVQVEAHAQEVEHAATG